MDRAQQPSPSACSALPLAQVLRLPTSPPPRSRPPESRYLSKGSPPTRCRWRSPTRTRRHPALRPRSDAGRSTSRARSTAQHHRRRWRSEPARPPEVCPEPTRNESRGSYGTKRALRHRCRPQRERLPAPRRSASPERPARIRAPVRDRVRIPARIPVRVRIRVHLDGAGTGEPPRTRTLVARPANGVTLAAEPGASSGKAEDEGVAGATARTRTPPGASSGRRKPKIICGTDH